MRGPAACPRYATPTGLTHTRAARIRPWWTWAVVELYRKGGFTKDVLIGTVRVPKLSLEIDNRPHEQWFPLRVPNARKGRGQRARRTQLGGCERVRLTADPPAWRRAPCLARWLALASDADEEGPAVSEPSTSTEAAESRKHDFKPYAFTAPVFCDLCRTFLWGAKRFGLKCDFCGYNCHKECESSCRATCGTVGAVRIRYRYTDEYILPLPSYRRLLEVRPPPPSRPRPRRTRPQALMMSTLPLLLGAAWTSTRRPVLHR